MMQNTEICKQPTLPVELTEITNRINKRVSTTAYDVGWDLIRAKDLCGHGEWLPFLEQAGIHERNAQRMMRYVRLVGEADDVQALPSVYSVLGKDKRDTYQAVENLVDAIKDGMQLLDQALNFLVDNDEAAAAIRLAASILRNITKWMDEKKGTIKPDKLSDLAKGVSNALKDAKELLPTENNFHEHVESDQFLDTGLTQETRL